MRYALTLSRKTFDAGIDVATSYAAAGTTTMTTSLPFRAATA
jgi:hypothetical protein